MTARVPSHPPDEPDLDQPDEDLSGYKMLLERFDDRQRELLDRLDRDVVAWTPKPGDSLIGTVVGRSTAASEYGPYPLLEVDTPDGVCVQVHCFHTILKNEVEGRQVVEGDKIGIRYLGRQGRNDMARYRVIVERGARQVPPPVTPRAFDRGHVEEEPF